MQTNRSVERALSILLYVCQSDRSLGLTEIAHATQLDKATTLRFLNTLINADMVRYENGAKRYIQGPGIYNFWPSEIKKICRPHMQTLLNKVQETVCIIVPRGEKRICIDSIEPDRELRIVAPKNRELPIHIGASGRVFMAYRPRDQVESILKNIDSEELSLKDEKDAENYLQQLDAVKLAGYAHNVGEVTQDTSTIAAPIFDALGNTAAVVVLRAPSTRMAEHMVPDFAILVKQAAKSISDEMASINSSGRQ